MMRTRREAKERRARYVILSIVGLFLALLALPAIGIGFFLAIAAIAINAYVLCKAESFAPLILAAFGAMFGVTALVAHLLFIFFISIIATELLPLFGLFTKFPAEIFPKIGEEPLPEFPWINETINETAGYGVIEEGAITGRAGEPISVDNFTISVARRNGEGYWKLRAVSFETWEGEEHTVASEEGKIFIRISLTIRNNANESRAFAFGESYISPTLITDIDSYWPIYRYELYWRERYEGPGERGFFKPIDFFKELAPGEEERGHLLFEIPAGEEPHLLRLYYGQLPNPVIAIIRLR